ncbi:MAG: ACP S-malonyltransferase [Lachnospiraceae bacterium]
MGKIAFIFPGQGSQYVGMGEDFYQEHEIYKEVIESASKASGLNLVELLYKENSDIHVTEFTQIAVLATEIAMLRVVEAYGVRADVTAGLSLGEYAALVASGTLLQEDAFWVVRKRGMLMQDAYPTGGAMVAVLGADTAFVEDICSSIELEVSIANYNCPGQIVITGEREGVLEATRILKDAGIRKCIPLKVSGPFHSSLLKEAGVSLGRELEAIAVRTPDIPYITNVTGDYVTDEGEVKNLLSRQVFNSVRWEQSMERMIADGVDTFIEIGPGKTLTGFMKKINPDVTCIQIEKSKDLVKLDPYI